MDFLRKLFRGEQHDPLSAPDNQPAPDTTAAVARHTQDSAPHTAATNETPTDPAAASAAETPCTSDEHAPSERQWWEDSTPLGESSPTVVTISAPAYAADPPADSAAVDPPDEEVATPSAQQTANNSVLTPSKAPTEPLTISMIYGPAPISEELAEQPAPVHPETTSDREALGASTSEDLAGATTPDAGSEQVATTVDMEEDGTHRLSFESAPSLSSQHSAQGLAAAALRDVGRMRQNNQDSVFSMLTTLPREGSDPPMGLFVLADGMGGHDSGELASRLAVRTVTQEIIAQLIMPALDDTMTEALQPLMVAAVQEANRVIWDQAQTVQSDMGTTCTAVLLMGQALYIAHVGDTRAYLLEVGGLRCLTDDHSAVGRLIQLGQLEPSAARDHPLRSQLYRTIGQQPQVQVDFIYQPFSESSHLLICSDGLWGMISEEEIQQALMNNLWPHDACRELIALANLAGGEDNISAIVVTLPIAERSSQ